MSNSIAHRSHAHHVPLLPVFAVVATVLIATAVIWAINHWAVPFHPYWIILPTVFMAALVTAVYLGQR